MNKKALKEIVDRLYDTSSPACGLSKLLLDEIINIECDVKPRLTSTELSHVANSLVLLCQSMDRSAGHLYDRLEDQKEASQ